MGMARTGYCRKPKLPNQPYTENGQTKENLYALSQIKTANNSTLVTARAQKTFNGMGNAAKTLFGDNHSDTSKPLDAAAKEQAARTAIANKPSLSSKVANKAAHMVGAGTGGRL